MCEALDDVGVARGKQKTRITRCREYFAGNDGNRVDDLPCGERFGLADREVLK